MLDKIRLKKGREMTNDEIKDLAVLSGEKARLKLAQLLQKQDRTGLDGVVRKLTDLLDAHNVKVFSNQGILTYSERLKDNRTQLEALHLLLQIYDSLPSARHQLDIPENTVEMILNLAGKDKKGKGSDQK